MSRDLFGSSPCSGGAIYVDIRIARHAAADPAMDAVADALDLAEDWFAGAGLVVAVSTGSSLLGVELYAPTMTSAARRADAVALARLAADLHAEIVALDGADHLEVAVTVHRGAVQIAGERPIGGPLVDLDSWGCWGGPGAFATPAALRGVDEPRLALRTS